MEMTPDDIRELEDEVSGFTRWDDNNERYSGELDGLNDYDTLDLELADEIYRWNNTSLWAKIKRKFGLFKMKFLLWFNRDKIPF